MRKIIGTLFLAMFASFCAIGCADFVRSANDYLAKPVTTQPSAPTHEQVITSTTQAVQTFAPSPFSSILGMVVTGGLLVLHNLDSRNRTKSTDQTVKDNHLDTSLKIEDLTNTVAELVTEVQTLKGAPPQQATPLSH